MGFRKTVCLSGLNRVFGKNENFFSNTVFSKPILNFGVYQSEFHCKSVKSVA